VQIELGPVPSDSVRAWIEFARETVDLLRSDPGDVPPRALDRFVTYLDEWAAPAESSKTFRWMGELTVEPLEYLTNWLYRTGVRVQADAAAGSKRAMPPAADKFYVVLVRSMLGALEREGSGPAQFAEQMRAEWGPVAGPD